MNYTLESLQEGTVLLIDKPLKWTSFDAVNYMRNRICKRLGVKNIKVGHAGTLDPLATGLLVICTGKFTKRIEEFQGMTKEYTGTFKLGATTPSYDRETEEDKTFPTEHLTPELLTNATFPFLGNILQKPPIFSAIKKDGKELYHSARKGIAVEVQPRAVTIDRFDLTRIELPEVDFAVTCSKGTYIRSMAYDFGEAVKSGAYLTALRRTAIGEFRIENAISPEAFVALLPPMKE